MNDQAKRFRNATLVVTTCAAGAASLVLFLVKSVSENINVGFDAVLILLGTSIGTFLAVKFFWCRAMRKKETRKRGLWLGLATGPIALVLSAYISTWLVMLYAGLTAFDTWKENPSLVLSVFMILFLAPLLLSIVGFFLGGFLTLPAGALFGWFFSRDAPDKNVDVFD